MSNFLRLKLEPGSYSCTFVYPSGERQPGQLDLEAGTAPHGEIFGWIPGQEQETSFPRDPVVFPEIRCELRMGYELVLFEASVEMWFPGRCFVRARMAVVGHAASLDPTSSFQEASLQIAGGHRVFGLAPIRHTFGPATMPAEGEVEFKAVFDTAANRSYVHEDREMRCRYWSSATHMDYFHFDLRTAPVFELRQGPPTGPLQWMADYVIPLRELITLATLERQEVCWLELDPAKEEPFSSTQVFAKEVTQAPYCPKYDPENDGRALFRFSELPYSPVELVERWAALRATHEHFIEPLMRGLIEPNDSRSGFLLLVQALEGLHAEIYGSGEQSVDEHKIQRDRILTEVKRLGLEKPDRAFLHRWLDSFGRYSLGDRLSQLRDDVAEDVGTIVNLALVPGSVAIYRNKISHGAGSVAPSELRPVNRALAALGVAHVLRLLDLPRDRMPHLFRS